MSLPTSYLMTVKNLGTIFQAMQGAKAPSKFSMAFIVGLGFKAKSDRLMIGVLKSLKFLSDTGEPTARYFEFLDPTQAPGVLAMAIEEAYADLYQVNTQANKLAPGEVKNKLKTLTQGQYSDDVLAKMASTFVALCEQADFSAQSSPFKKEVVKDEISKDNETPDAKQPKQKHGITFSGLQYVINIQLPESRDQAVYDALFKSLREHLQ